MVHDGVADDDDEKGDQIEYQKDGDGVFPARGMQVGEMQRQADATSRVELVLEVRRHHQWKEAEHECE